ELSLDFRPGADMQFALQQVQGRIASLQPELPGGVHIFAERLTPSVFPMMQFELTGGDPILLRDLAQYTIRPRLARLPDVGEVEVQGGLVREVSVVLDPARLVSHHIGAKEVADRILDANVVEAAGRVDREYRQLSVIVSGLAATADAVGALVLRRDGEYSVRVSDLGTVRYGAEDQFLLATGDGQPAALINVSRQPAGNILRVERAVIAMADSLRQVLPANVKLESVYNQGELVRSSIGNVRDAMIVGGVLAVIVLLLFLHQPVVTIAAALTLPLTILGTFAGLRLFGDSLNLMSLGGLAVAVGLIIDDAVVVVENIERRLAQRGDDAPADVIRRATDEILAPVAGSTLTTVVVFAPLALLEGVVGQFFQSFALALTIAVLISLALALFLIPLLTAQWVEWQIRTGKAERTRVAAPRIARLENWYVSRAGVALRRPGLALAAAGLLVILAFGLWQVVGTGFLPQMDEGGFILDYWTPTGSSLTETDRQLHRIEAILKEDPDVERFTRRTGFELGFFATAPNTGDMTVQLRPRRSRASVYQVIDRLRTRIATEVPAVRVEFLQITQDLLGDLTGAPNPVEIKLFHPEVRVAEAAGRKVAGEIEAVPGLEDLFDGVTGDIASIRVNLDPVRVSRLGLTPADALAQVHAALFGEDAGAVREPDRLVPIRVRVPDSVRFNPAVARTLPIIGPNGWAPLGGLGTVADSSDVSELWRENLRPMVMVTGAVDPEASNLGHVMRAIRQRLSGLALPPGVSLEYGGQYVGQRESFRQLLVVLVLAIGIVLLVMVGQFGQFRGALAILLAASLGLTGALLALVITGMPFNVSSFMGLILLVGLIVKNGIILLDAAQRIRRRGATPETAVREAGRLRLRPILMTTLCTLAGLLPLAFGIGSGAELQQPLAIAVIGGLTLSTLITLVLLPAGLLGVGALERSNGNGEQGTGTGK
ncbi:MAG TPA: efflux RND transporter permease subunit, partial [Gemmatimonadales bacterium]|nr:efflux RND transporter permease subunit [Gemmatimonadales bacterium]